MHDRHESVSSANAAQYYRQKASKNTAWNAEVCFVRVDLHWHFLELPEA